MYLFKTLKKRSLIVGITGFFLVAFIFFLTFFVLLFGQKIQSTELTSQIKKAYKFSVLDKETSFIRAFTLLSDYKNFGLFTNRCDPFHISDLSLNTNSCLSRDKKYKWIEIDLGGKNYILGHANDFNIQIFLNENIKILQITTLAFFAFTLFFCFFGVWAFIVLPTEIIHKEVETTIENKGLCDKPFPEDRRHLFFSLFKSLNKLVYELSEFNKKKARLELSRQVVHDLRSPISLLEDQVKGNDVSTSIIENSVKRIKQISESLLHPEKVCGPIDVNKIHDDLVELSKLYKMKMTFSTNVIDFRIAAKISDQDLYRFLSNALKNSHEAGAKNIAVELHARGANLAVTIIDDGPGIDEDKLTLIRNGAFTDKINGNGLGLSFIRQKILGVGGEYKLENIDTRGLRIFISFPILFNPLDVKKVILLDDDKYVGLNWHSKAKTQFIPFVYFKTFESLLEKLTEFSPDDTFFVDKNLTNETGLYVLEQLFNKGFTNLFLASGEEIGDNDFPHYIKGNVGKSWPF